MARPAESAAVGGGRGIGVVGPSGAIYSDVGVFFRSSESCRYALSRSRTLSGSRTKQICYPVPEPATRFWNGLSRSRTGQARLGLGLGFRVKV